MTDTNNLDDFNANLIAEFRANDGKVGGQFEGEERSRLWRAQADLMPGFDDYQKNTTRVIPVIVLERV